jgi:peptide/nickel transport system permease protein
VTGLLWWLVRRVALGALTLLVIAFVTYGMLRLLIPQRYHGTPLIAGTVQDVGRGFLHFDWGRACNWPGCPPVQGLFKRSFAADLWLIGGALVIGVAGGLLGAMWCARRPKTRRARAIEGVATTLYCTPVYVLGFGLLLLFEKTFGIFPIPFLNATPTWAEPWANPGEWLGTLAVPWLVLAAPLAAMVLRLALAVLREEVDANHVRTAIAKGVSPRRVMSRHVAPGAFAETASFVAISIPLIVLNLMLVEQVFGVPGFFRNLYRATGHVLDWKGDPVVDYVMIQAISIWAAVIIVGLGIVVDLFLVRIDPRIREAGLPG